RELGAVRRAGQRHGEAAHGRRAVPGRGGAHQRRGRDPRARRQRVRRLLQRPAGHGAGAARRLAAHGRRRLPRGRRPARGARAGVRGGAHPPAGTLHPDLHRAPAEVQPVHQGCLRARRRARLPRRPGRHRLGGGGTLGAGARHPVHLVRGPVPAAAGLRPGRRHRGGGQCHAAGGDPDPPLRQPAQGIRPGRRRGDPHPQVAAQRDRRSLPRDHRRPLRWPRLDRVRGADHLRDRGIRRTEAGARHPRRGDGNRGGGERMSYFLELLVNGALTGLMYSMVALGIVLIYKSSSVLNFSQGAMVMVGGYVVWLLTSAGLQTYVAMAVGFVVMFAFGLLAERLLLRKMVGQPIIMIVMLTLGLDIFLRGLAPGVLGTTPKHLDLGIDIAPVVWGDVFVNRAYLLGGVIALVLIAFALLFFRTRLGTKLRAVSDDHVASWSVGISVEQAVAVSWGLAGICA